MFNYIEKLRRKPAGVKKQIAFVTSFFIAGIIFVVWVSVIYPDWRDGQMQTEQSSSEPSPISTLGSTFSNAFSSISTQFSEIKNVISSFASTTNNTSTTSEPILESSSEQSTTAN